MKPLFVPTLALIVGALFSLPSTSTLAAEAQDFPEAGALVITCGGRYVKEEGAEGCDAGVPHQYIRTSRHYWVPGEPKTPFGEPLEGLRAQGNRTILLMEKGLVLRSGEYWLISSLFEADGLVFRAGSPVNIIEHTESSMSPTRWLEVVTAGDSPKLKGLVSVNLRSRSVETFELAEPATGMIRSIEEIPDSSLVNLLIEGSPDALLLHVYRGFQ